MIFKTDHRYPLALVDRVLEEVTLSKVTAIKNVSFNEKIFSGHFPDKPIYPAIYIVEGLCQCAQIMLGAKIAVTAKLEDFKFTQQVVPGDQLRYEIILESMIGQFQIAKGKVYVGSTIVAKGKVIGCSLDGGA